MAIGFARLEFVKRSDGKNACAKAAYNCRGRIRFEGTKLAQPQTYDWSRKPRPAYHAVILPVGVDDSYGAPAGLWNAVEKAETRKNSQVALELVLALPDDSVLSLEDRVHLTRSFVAEHFVSKRLGVQVDIHPPDKREVHSDGMVASVDHNWHAHVVVTTRAFSEKSAEGLGKKAREEMPVIRGGRVISGPDWGKLWTGHQNTYFEERGLNLRVDPTGIVPQRHLGPVRMRARALSLLNEHCLRASLNDVESLDPGKILAKLTERQSVFQRTDFEYFLAKHVQPEQRSAIREAFWRLSEIISLEDPTTGQQVGRYTSRQVMEEERRALRLADTIYQTQGVSLNRSKVATKALSKLTDEQQRAFLTIAGGPRLACVEGHAGAGKSYLLMALRGCYLARGHRVRAFGPDNSTASTLKERGFDGAENVYRFLFGLHHGHREIRRGREVWVLDEAGKLGNRPMLELLKAAARSKAQLILAGSTSQLPPVERGNLFREFVGRYGAVSLQNIQRQKSDQQRSIARSLATGDMTAALDQLVRAGGIMWTANKQEAIEELISKWAEDREHFPGGTSIIIAHTNAEVKGLNEVVREYRRSRGELAATEYACETVHGKVYMAVGDMIEFRKNDKEIGVSNGLRGTLVKASSDRFVVALRQGKCTQHIAFNPGQYQSFQLGYASTFYRAQGQTVDRAYVLHSDRMNKPMFYVGLTRHTRKAFLFVSRDEINCMADLKRQALLQEIRPTTLDYVSASHLHRQHEQDPNHDRNSAAILWDRIRYKVSALSQRMRDRRPDRSFYRPTRDSPESGSGAVRVLQAESPTSDSVRGSRLSEGSDPRELGMTAISPGRLSFNKPLSQFQPSDGPAQAEPPDKPHRAPLAGFTGPQREALFSYLAKRDEVLLWRNLADNDCASRKEWLVACGVRNQSAGALVKLVSPSLLERAMSSVGAAQVQDQAARYQASRRFRGEPSLGLQERLRENLEALMFRLYPEGSTGRSGTSLRFGSKGSLAVVCCGPKTGTFYDFENREGGGLLRLIQKCLGSDELGARDWAESFLGEASGVELPQDRRVSVGVSASMRDWVSQKPQGEPPDLSEVSRSLASQYTEVSRHHYRDERGELLFCTLRLVRKEDSRNKIVLPLSYGRWSGSMSRSGWRMKGFGTTGLPLYNLHLLSEHPNAKILVVEGEKTADAAVLSPLMEGLISVSWCGGASSVQKTDWEPLRGRDVVVWPDNDAAGRDAAEQVCRELRRMGVRSLEVVDLKRLSRGFPEKWDLADPLPPGVGLQDVKDMVLSAESRALSADRVVVGEGVLSDVEEVLKMQVHEILWRVDNRLRRQNQDEGQMDERRLQQAVVQTTEQIINEDGRLVAKMARERQLSEKVVKRVAFHAMIFEAERGCPPSPDKLTAIQETVLAKASRLTSHLSCEWRERVSEEIVNHAVDRVILAREPAACSDKALLEGEIQHCVAVITRDRERAEPTCQRDLSLIDIER